MPKTPIEVLDTVLELGTEALIAYQNPAYGSGINANAAGGIFSNLISRHGITPTTLQELRATLEPIGTILADPAGTEEAALDVIARLKKAYPTLFSVPDYPDVGKLNEEIALLKAELQTTHLAASAQIDRLTAANTIAEDGSVPPVPEGAETFTPTHALISALVDTKCKLLKATDPEGDDLSREEWEDLMETVDGALEINSEVKAIAVQFLANLNGDDEDEEEPPEHPFIAEVAGFTPRTEPTVLSEASFDNAPLTTGRTETGRLPTTPKKANAPREQRRGGRGRGR